MLEFREIWKNLQFNINFVIKYKNKMIFLFWFDRVKKYSKFGVPHHAENSINPKIVMLMLFKNKTRFFIVCIRKNGMIAFSKKYQRTMLSIHFSSNNVCEFGFKEYRRFSDFNFISDGRNVFLFLAFEIHYQLANWKRCWISNKRIPLLLHLAGCIN